MRRFEFRLERVLKVKKQRERLAEVRQQQTRLAVEAVNHRIASLNQDLLTAALGLQQKVGRALPTGGWLAINAHAERLGKALQTAQTDLVNAERELSEAARLRTLVAKEVEALKHLRDRAWQVHREEAEAAQQAQLDEMGLRGWAAGRTTGGSATVPAEEESDA